MNPKTGNFFVLISICAIVVAAKTVPRRQQRSTATCGVPKISLGLIVRGQKFTRGNFPWIVALMYTKEYPPMFFCAGTLISKTFVLSAAHCINEKHSSETLLPRDVLAFFGAHSLNNYFESGRYSLSPKKIFLHDDWNPSTNQYDGDLSLLEFEEESIHFNTFVQPICQWNSEKEPTVTTGIVSGWGKSADPTRKHENEPKMISAPIQRNECCLPGEIELSGLSSTRTFCAGLKNGSGICHGDSGGGLFIKVKEVFYLRGIVSSSLIKDSSCDVSKNAVYTNVFKFRDWINKVTGDVLVSLTPAVRQVLCTFEIIHSYWLLGFVNTCVIKQTIDREDYVLGDKLDTTVEQFYISYNKAVVFLPRHIGEKLANLKEFWVRGCGLTMVRNHYFKDMYNLQSLYLNGNKISTIEPGSFKDLTRVRRMWLTYNMIETLDKNLFDTMVNLEGLHLTDNKIMFLSPTTFRIPGGKLWWVYLRANVCISGWYYWYGPYNFDKLEEDIRTHCKG